MLKTLIPDISVEYPNPVIPVLSSRSGNFLVYDLNAASTDRHGDSHRIGSTGIGASGVDHRDGRRGNRLAGSGIGQRAIVIAGIGTHIDPAAGCRPASAGLAGKLRDGTAAITTDSGIRACA